MVRNLEAGDGRALGQLFFDAYKGTVDDEGQTLEQAVEEAEATFAGRYGPVIWRASYVVLDKSKIISTSVVTDYKEIPLVAFAATLPSYQGQGLARLTMKKSIEALAELGRHEVRLVVTETNTRALSLYERLGFVAIDNRLRTESA
jgi:GNAT superfamily N-acetyltransferase